VEQEYRQAIKQVNNGEFQCSGENIKRHKGCILQREEKFSDT